VLGNIKDKNVQTLNTNLNIKYCQAFFAKVISEKHGKVTKKGNSCVMLGLMQR